jgi:hypothetical protein
MKAMDLKRKLSEVKRENEKFRKEESILLQDIFNQGEMTAVELEMNLNFRYFQTFES